MKEEFGNIEIECNHEELKHKYSEPFCLIKDNGYHDLGGKDISYISFTVEEAKWLIQKLQKTLNEYGM